MLPSRIGSFRWSWGSSGNGTNCQKTREHRRQRLRFDFAEFLKVRKAIRVVQGDEDRNRRGKT
jgi:hypothetical protein